jgi:hypothetical protein
MLQVAEVKPKTQERTYTFFYVDDLCAAARSSTGSLNVLCRLPPAQQAQV